MPRLKLTGSEVNTLFPIRGVKFYKRAIVLSRCFNGENMFPLSRGVRKQITSISQRSLNKLVLTVSASDVKLNSLLTLTYGVNYPMNGKQVKIDLNRFITYMRRSFGGFEYFWFLEFQRRGAPHLHFVSELPGPGRCERDLMAELWSKIASPLNLAYTAISSPYERKNAQIGANTQDSVFRQHRRVETWQELRSEDGAVRYALKYALKTRQKSVPREYRNVGRFWATSEGLRLGKAEEYPLTEAEARDLVFYLGRNMASWEVLPKIIFHTGNLPNPGDVDTM